MGPGETIADKYRVLSVLGEGGSGTTYEAESLATGERVALKKVVLKGAATWKSVELFEREARVLANVTHAAIPRYVDHFTVEGPEGPTFYLAQTLAPGRSLQRWVDEGARVDEAEATRIARDLLAILHYLHTLSPPILHRDIKPANVMRGDDGRILLVDFGAVRDTYRETQSGGSTIAGTYGYMAPEQFRGVATPATDLHGLGAMLLFLLARRTPAELPQKKLRVEIPRELGLSPAFSAWLSKLLEPAPEDRFQSAPEALKALDARRSPGRTRMLALGGVLGVLLCGGAVFVAKTERSIAKQDAQKTRPAVALLPPRLDRVSLPDFEEQRRIPAHGNAVMAIAVAPDASFVATAGFDSTVRMFRSADGTALRTLGHQGRVGSVVITPDGKTLASGDVRVVRTWNADDGAPGKTFDAGSAQVTQLALDPKGTVIAAGSFDGSVRTWSFPEGAPQKTFAHSPGKGRVLGVRYSPDGALLATTGDDTTIKLWNVSTGSLERTLGGHEKSVTAIAFSHDGTQLASASDDRTVRVWFVPTGRLSSTMKGARDDAWSVAFSPDGRWLAGGSKDGLLRVWSLPAMSLQSAHAMQQGISSIAFAPDSSAMFAGSAGGALTVHRVPGSSHVALPVPKAGAPDPIPTSPPELGLAMQARILVSSYGGRSADLDEAESLLKKALAARKEYAPALVQLARVEYRRGFRSGDNYDPKRLAAALEILARAEASDPKLYELHVARAWVFRFMKEPARARKSLTVAEGLDPSRVETELVHASFAQSEKAWDEVIRRASRALAGSTDPIVHHSAWQSLADAYAERHEYDAADACHRKMIELEPKTAWIHGNYATYLNARGEFARAAESARRAIAISDYPAAHGYLAHAYLGLGVAELWDHQRADKAQEYFDAALREQTPYGDAHYGLACVLRYRGLTTKNPKLLDDSEKELKKALAIDPQHWYAKQALAEHGAVVASL